MNTHRNQGIALLITALVLITATIALVTYALGTKHTDTKHTDTAMSVGIEGCSSDCGLADEPASLVNGRNPAYGPVACSMATYDLEDGPDQVTPALAKRCDYRVTGEACWEDEICAVQAIRETGDFKR